MIKKVLLCIAMCMAMCGIVFFWICLYKDQIISSFTCRIGFCVFMGINIILANTIFPKIIRKI